MTVTLDRLRIPLRRSDLDRLLEADAALTAEEKKIRELLADEHALDLGIPDMPRYGEMFDELVRAHGKKFERALVHPEESVGHRWPLYAGELSTLLTAVDPKLACSAATIERLDEAELIARPLRIGAGKERALTVYFGRHFVEIAYSQHHGFKPSEERARLEGLRQSIVGRAQRLFWGGHPSLPHRPASRRPSR